MHTLQLLAVDVNGDYTDQCAEAALDDVLAGDDGWFDYFSVGGRWDGYFTENGDELPKAKGLQSGNVLPITKFPNVAIAALEMTIRRQDREFLNYRDYFTGASVAVADLPGHVFGLPVAQTQEAADRATSVNKESAAQWQELLHANSLNDIVGRRDLGMVAWRMRRILNLIDGYWCADSGFCDFTNPDHGHTADPRRLIRLIKEDAAQFDGAALVVTDFHY